MNHCKRSGMLVVVAVFFLVFCTARAQATLLSYWSFDDGAGTTLTDHSGNSFDGTLEGAILPTWVSGTTGKSFDKALSFTAAGQAGAVKYDSGLAPNTGSSRVDVGLTSALKLLGNETISMWLRPNASSVRQNVFGISYSGAGAIVLENVDAATQVLDGFNFYYGSGGDNCCTHNTGVDSTAITRDGSTWTHVVFRRDGGVDNLQPWTSSILFNGVDVTTVGGGSPFTMHDVNEAVLNNGDNPSSRVYLGAGYVTSFDGLIDDTAIWDRPLTDGEVNALYEARTEPSNPLFQADIDVADLEQLFQVHLDAGASTVIIDSVLYSYSADVGTMFPSLGLGEALQSGPITALLLDLSGTGVLGVYDPNAIPEPSSFLLLGLGMAGLLRHVRRRRQKG